MSLLNFFTTDAYAAGAGGAAGQGTQGILGFLPLIVIFVIFYFMLIRPQSKRSKEHRNMVANLGKGDEVVTNGGVLGKIVDLGESFITLELAENITIKIQRHAVANVMPKGTMKSA